MQLTSLNLAVLTLIEKIGEVAIEIGDLAPNSHARRDLLLMLPGGGDLDEISSLCHYLHELTWLGLALKNSEDNSYLLKVLNDLIYFLRNHFKEDFVFALPPLKYRVDNINLDHSSSFAQYRKITIVTINQSGAKNYHYGYSCNKINSVEGVTRTRLHDGVIQSVEQIRDLILESGSTNVLNDSVQNEINIAPELGDLLITISRIYSDLRHYADWDSCISDEILSYCEINILNDFVLGICRMAEIIKSNFSTLRTQNKIKSIEHKLKLYTKQDTHNPFTLKTSFMRTVGSYASLGTKKYYYDKYQLKNTPDFLKSKMYEWQIGCKLIFTQREVIPLPEMNESGERIDRCDLPLNAISSLGSIRNKLKD